MKKFIIIGVSIFILSLIIYVPASIASKLLPENISAQQFHGNVWDGSASSLSVNNIFLGSVSWELKPSCLLIFKLCAQIKQTNQNITSSFLLKIRSTIELHKLKAEGDTEILKSLLKKYGINPSGSFSADMLKIVLTDGQIKSMEGKLRLSSLALSGVLRVLIGDVDSFFTPKDDHTQITIANNKGHIDVKGNVDLHADLSYQLEMNIKKNALSTDAVINGMQYVGKSLPDGSRQLQQSGKLAI